MFEKSISPQSLRMAMLMLCQRKVFAIGDICRRKPVRLKMFAVSWRKLEEINERRTTPAWDLSTGWPDDTDDKGPFRYVILFWFVALGDAPFLLILLPFEIASSLP
jgi:hypothetical protein